MENMLQLDLFDFDNEVMEIAPEPQPVRTEPRTELPLHASVRILGPEESGRGNYRIRPDDELFPHGQKSKIHSNIEPSWLPHKAAALYTASSLVLE